MKRLLVLVAFLAVCLAEPARTGSSPHAENQPIIEPPVKGADVDPTPVGNVEIRKGLPPPPISQATISPPPRGETARDQLNTQAALMHAAYLKQLEEEREHKGYLPPTADAPPAGSGSAQDENEDKLAQPKETVHTLPNYSKYPSQKPISQPSIPPPSDSPAGTKQALLQMKEELPADMQDLYANENANTGVSSSGLPVLDAPGDDAAKVMPSPKALRGAPAPEKKWAPTQIHSDLPTIDAPDAVAAPLVAAAKPVAKVVNSHPYQSWEHNAQAARARAESQAIPVDAPGSDVAEVPKPAAKPVARKEDDDKWVKNVSAEMHEAAPPTASIGGDDGSEVVVKKQVKVAPIPSGPTKWAHNVDEDLHSGFGLPTIDSPGDDAKVTTPHAAEAPVRQYKGEPSPPHIPAPTRQWDN